MPTINRRGCRAETWWFSSLTSKATSTKLMYYQENYTEKFSVVHLLQEANVPQHRNVVALIAKNKHRGDNHKMHNCWKWGRRCFSCRYKTITHFTKLFQQQMNGLHMHYTNSLEFRQVHQDWSTILRNLMMQGPETCWEPKFPFLQNWDFDTRTIENHGKFLLVLHCQW